MKACGVLYFDRSRIGLVPDERLIVKSRLGGSIETIEHRPWGHRCCFLFSFFPFFFSFFFVDASSFVAPDNIDALTPQAGIIHKVRPQHQTEHDSLRVGNENSASRHVPCLPTRYLARYVFYCD